MAHQDTKDDVPRNAKRDSEYVEHIEHVEATRPEPWPGIPGRSLDDEQELPTGTPRDQQASVTREQRRLEEEEAGDDGSTRR
ncbi:hypothetical protein LZ198_41830 [Myxococcus sp. K15C18031901]|uniref:hypothetical protein n=1 Tax=Myxococcus dinghuensis TaxID=2906761 RepID=UPI0020A7E9A0|nr:hypothetical protein [Myxococcus dinghuensis]MCP3105423.1 hypothetical protein [Myxococcus dinghuensis]